MSPEPKIVITGTGRAGTTLLVQVLTDLGLDTGFSADAPIDTRASAGLETGIEAPDAPRIVKNPNLSRRLGELLDAGKVEIEHVIIPIRDLDVAAASRVRNTGYGTDLHTLGGLFGTARATQQREALALIFYELMYTIARYDLPHTLLLFPRFAEDWEYTYEKLSFLAPEIPAARWQEVLEHRASPELIHEEPLTSAERAKTYAGTVYNRGVARPLRGVRRMLDRQPTDAPPPPLHPVGRPDDDRVVMHIASWNTESVTELCIRSMRHYAGRDFDLVVGDGGSSDGSLDMLAALEARGWLRLEVAPEGRKHAEWLDHWVETSPGRYAGFSDSDVEYLGAGWLDDLVTAAKATNAALTCARMQWPPAEFVHPTTGAARRLAPRPTPWLFLLDLHQVRDRVHASFRYRDEIDPDAFGGKVAYDVGAAYYAALCAAGLTWTEMPDAFQAKFRHFGGLTWLKAGNAGASWRVRSKQLTKLGLVHAHLLRARASHWGDTIVTSSSHS